MIDKELLLKLRKETSAGFSDCKKALESAENDYEKAISVLKEMGMAKSLKKMNNDTEYKVYFVEKIQNDVVFVKISAETDFALKSDKCCEFVSNEAKAFHDSGLNSISDVIINNETFEERLKFFISTISENIKIESEIFKCNSNEELTCYIHGKINPDYSNIGSTCVVLKSTKVENSDLFNKVCVHIAASDPVYLNSPDCEHTEDEVLLNQDYFYNNSLTVKQFSEQNNFQIIDFKLYK